MNYMDFDLDDLHPSAEELREKLEDTTNICTVTTALLDYYQDEYCRLNISWDSAADVVTSVDDWEASIDFSNVNLLAVVEDVDLKAFGRDLAIADPARALELLTELQYWKDNGRL